MFSPHFKDEKMWALTGQVLCLRAPCGWLRISNCEGRGFLFFPASCQDGTAGGACLIPGEGSHALWSPIQHSEAL